MTEVMIHCLWLPSSHGGRRSEPHSGLRLGIRWQRYIQEDGGVYRDAQFEKVWIDPATRQGPALVKLVSEVPDDWLRQGELVEILEGFKVVAVAYVSREGDS